VSPRLMLDFLRRQVLMSRNISGGWLTSVLIGGLVEQGSESIGGPGPR
jgi:hypothetical protein